jgi:hypothetical protein
MYTARHIGGGEFTATLHETGEVKECGPGIRGMIRYTYFEDFTLPEVGWEITQEQLMKDYFPKLQKDITEGKLPKQ